MGTKQCTKCREEFPLLSFPKNAGAKDGRKSTCTPCLKKYLAKYYKLNKPRALYKAAEYRKDNREAIRLRDRERYKNLRADPIKGEAYRQKRNFWYNKRMASDPVFKLKNTMRSRIVAALKAGGKIKDKKTTYLLGCTIPDLKQHLETRFESGMSWKNHGEWHIDHIIPCDAFDLTNIAHQRVAFHFSNLQPLWAEPNLIKSASVPKNFNLQKHINKTIKKIDDQ